MLFRSVPCSLSSITSIGLHFVPGSSLMAVQYDDTGLLFSRVRGIRARASSGRIQMLLASLSGETLLGFDGVRGGEGVCP